MATNKAPKLNDADKALFEGLTPAQTRALSRSLNSAYESKKPAKKATAKKATAKKATAKKATAKKTGKKK